MREQDITALVALEWDFFQDTQNIGGRAACQNDYTTFWVMRKGQAMAWTNDMVCAWLQDLRQAKKNGRNPVAEKYARMMKTTDPEEYQKLEHLLPLVTFEAAHLAKEITAQTVTWAEQAAKSFPCFCARGRPLYKDSDTIEQVSLETYCYCELLTCSLDTLHIFFRTYQEKAVRGENLYLDVENNIVKLMGYTSVEEIEQRLSSCR